MRRVAIPPWAYILIGVGSLAGLAVAVPRVTGATAREAVAGGALILLGIWLFGALLPGDAVRWPAGAALLAALGGAGVVVLLRPTPGRAIAAAVAGLGLAGSIYLVWQTNSAQGAVLAEFLFADADGHWSWAGAFVLSATWVVVFLAVLVLLLSRPQPRAG